MSKSHPVPSVFTHTVAPSYYSATTTTLLQAKKSGGGAATAGTKKVQVKMLKHVKGTGQAGEVVMVTPAYFNNKLRPTKSAVVISDEEKQKEEQEQLAAEKATLDQATALQSVLTAASDDDGASFALVIPSKAGPAGQLFGGIGPKIIMEELKKQVPHPFWEEARKGVKITAIMDGDAKKIRGDIKHTGDYSVSLSLTKDVMAKFSVNIVPTTE
eukprot:CAMPEP_0172443936 /NCGR_PEP_ID=MMETSP1065-20121228/4119_1 /TAXON_ID=265537 /ORGANISM="Amphiprora paludosa, Strain CCMP125" /LENGTH=213 /DNA_ID=CAMNT_0013194341 /DNA_START=191 /DNA_END=832 /DNA_ORIENTATION=+